MMMRTMVKRALCGRNSAWKQLAMRMMSSKQPGKQNEGPKLPRNTMEGAAPGIGIYEKAFEDEEEQYNIDVSNLPRRWPKMTPEDQQDVINYLQVKEGFAWTHLTKDDKRAAWYIGYGPWGPRDQADMTTPEAIFKGLSILLLFGCTAFAVVNYETDKKKIASLNEKAAVTGPTEEAD